MIATMIAMGAILKTQTVTVSFYGKRYDKGHHRHADRSIYNRDGKTCATYLFPLGTKIILTANGHSEILTVRDRTARQFGHRIDLPDGTWARFGYPMSQGLFQAKVVKK